MANLTTQERERNPPVWNMSQERVFRETLLHHRFNFFLAFFVAIVAGAINARTPFALRMVLGTGAVISSLLLVSIVRTQFTLLRIASELYRDENHPLSQLKKGQARHWYSSVTKIIGVLIPVLCCSLLLGGFIATWVPGGLSPDAFQPTQNPAK